MITTTNIRWSEGVNIFVRDNSIDKFIYRSIEPIFNGSYVYFQTWYDGGDADNSPVYFCAQIMIPGYGVNTQTDWVAFPRSSVSISNASTYLPVLLDLIGKCLHSEKGLAAFDDNNQANMFGIVSGSAPLTDSRFVLNPPAGKPYKDIEDYLFPRNEEKAPEKEEQVVLDHNDKYFFTSNTRDTFTSDYPIYNSHYVKLIENRNGDNRSFTVLCPEECLNKTTSEVDKSKLGVALKEVGNILGLDKRVQLH